MKWGDLLFRTAVRGVKQWQRDQARIQRQGLKQARQDETLRLKQASFQRRISLDREIGGLTPEEFEAFVASLFEKEGWQASLTSRSGDMGIDINLLRTSDGRRAVVRCKKYKGTVGQPVVRDLYGAMTHVKADEGYIVTTGRFSSAAISFTKGKSIRLVDGEALLPWVRRYKPVEVPVDVHDAKRRQDTSLSTANSLAGQQCEEAGANSGVFLNEQSRAFLMLLTDGFAEMRDLIESVRSAPLSSHAALPQSVLSNAQAEVVC